MYIFLKLSNNTNEVISIKRLCLTIIILVLLVGCAFKPDGPSYVTREYLEKYKINSKDIITELDLYLENENIDKNLIEDYRKVYLRQYSNLVYDIKDERIDGDDAFVDVQIKVYDYYKTVKDANDYLNDNQKEFINDDGDISFDKFFKYKLDKMMETDKRVDYLITINLKKEKEKWKVLPLSTTEMEKIHGLYEY